MFGTIYLCILLVRSVPSSFQSQDHTSYQLYMFQVFAHIPPLSTVHVVLSIGSSLGYPVSFLKLYIRFTQLSGSPKFVIINVSTECIDLLVRPTPIFHTKHFCYHFSPFCLPNLTRRVLPSN